MEAALDRLTLDITDHLAGTDPVVLCVMTGRVIAAGLLLPRLNFQLRLSYVHVNRYHGTTGLNYNSAYLVQSRRRRSLAEHGIARANPHGLTDLRRTCDQGRTTRGGDLSWQYRPLEAIRGEQVLILDDILDEGLTLEAIPAPAARTGRTPCIRRSWWRRVAPMSARRISSASMLLTAICSATD